MNPAILVAALLLILFAGLTVLRLFVRTSPNADLVADLLNSAGTDSGPADRLPDAGSEHIGNPDG